jgi:hypothetical protein
MFKDLKAPMWLLELNTAESPKGRKQDGKGGDV